MKPFLRCGLFTFLIITSALSPASAETLYEGEILAARGAAANNGTSLGAFSQTPGSFSFEGVVSTGNFVGSLLSLGSLLSPGAATGTTLTYAGGTAGVAPQPFSLSLYLPSLSGDPAPILYNMNGSASLSITSSPEGTTTVRFHGGSAFEDPLGRASTTSQSPAP